MISKIERVIAYRYLKPKSVVGIDISKDAVRLCKTQHGKPNLSFCIGDSEDIPFENNSFNAVINVESSHCYGDIPLFLSEVKSLIDDLIPICST